jgi:hypothetical protein
MKRLIEAIENDLFLGSRVEIINNRSKYYSFVGRVDKKYHNNKYRITIPPAQWEQTEHDHVIYVGVDSSYKWIRVMPEEDQQ